MQDANGGDNNRIDLKEVNIGLLNELCFRMGPSNGLIWIQLLIFGFYKKRITAQLVGRIPALQEVSQHFKAQWLLYVPPG
jgi:hypothetical protein